MKGKENMIDIMKGKENIILGERNLLKVNSEQWSALNDNSRVCFQMLPCFPNSGSLSDIFIEEQHKS